MWIDVQAWEAEGRSLPAGLYRTYEIVGYHVWDETRSGYKYWPKAELSAFEALYGPTVKCPA